ncbi:MAG: GNAT family N-acetyltransferase [Phycisphaerae bacterium]|nr:GNAT family N-acetyltransferase [Phycisphaerae bacterium]
MTDGECTIRPAGAADVAAAGELWQAMADQHAAYDAEAWSYRPDAKRRWCEEFASFLRQADKILLVAEDGGEIVGVAVLAVEEPLVEMARRRGIVREVVVAEFARGRGVATRLMDVAFEEMKARGAEEVVLHAALENATAVGFYEKLGMRRVMYRMYRKL